MEHARSCTVGINGAELDVFVEQGDILAFAGNGGNGVGGHVVTNVLEVGDDGQLFTWDIAASPCGATKVEDGLSSSDEDLAIPCLATALHGDINRETSAVFNTFGNDETEGILQSDGLFGSNHAKFGSTVEDAQALVVAAQSHVGDTLGRVDADVLKAHAEARLHVDGSEVR